MGGKRSKNNKIKTEVFVNFPPEHHAFDISLYKQLYFQILKKLETGCDCLIFIEHFWFTIASLY